MTEAGVASKAITSAVPTLPVKLRSVEPAGGRRNGELAEGALNCRNGTSTEDFTCPF